MALQRMLSKTLYQTALYVLFVLCTSMLLPVLQNPYRLPKELSLHFLILLILFLAMAKRSLYRFKDYTVYVFFLGSFLASSCVTNEPFEQLLQYISSFGFLVILSSASTLMTERDVYRIFWMCAALVPFQILLTGNPLELLLINKIKNVGFIGNSEFFASYLAALIFWARTLYYKPHKWWFIVFYIFAIVGVLLCRSRIVILITILCLLYSERRNLWTTIKRYSLLSFFVGFSFLTCVAYFHEKVFNLHTLYGRFLIWIVSLLMGIKNYGLGVGLNRYADYYLENQSSLFNAYELTFLKSNSNLTDRAHSIWLDYWAEGGWVLVLTVFFALYRIIDWEKIARSGNEKQLDFIIFFTSLSFVTSSFRLIPLQIIFVLALCRYVSKDGWMKGRDWRNYTVCCLLLLITTGTTWMVGEKVVANFYLQEAITSRSMIEKKEKIEMGLRIDSSDYRLNVELAKSLFLQKDFLEAKKLLINLREKSRRVDDLKMLADVNFQLGNFLDTIALYDSFLTSFPDHVTPYFMIAHSYLSLKNYDKARTFFELATEQKARSTRSRVEKIMAYDFLRKIKTR